MPTVTSLLNGYSLSSDQGSPAFCSIVLVESEGRRLVFDFGHVGRRRALRRVLAARGLEPADVDTVELPGHTPGSIGLTVATGEGTVVLTGDAVPTLKVLRSGQASGQPTDPEQANASIARVAALADFVQPGHDQLLRRAADGDFATAQERTPLVFSGAGSGR